MTDPELEALMRATGTEGYPSDVRRLVDAAQAAERERWAEEFDRRANRRDSDDPFAKTLRALAAELRA